MVFDVFLGQGNFLSTIFLVIDILTNTKKIKNNNPVIVYSTLNINIILDKKNPPIRWYLMRFQQPRPVSNLYSWTPSTSLIQNSLSSLIQNSIIYYTLLFRIQIFEVLNSYSYQFPHHYCWYTDVYQYKKGFQHHFLRKSINLYYLYPIHLIRFSQYLVIERKFYSRPTPLHHRLKTLTKTKS